MVPSATRSRVKDSGQEEQFDQEANLGLVVEVLTNPDGR